MRILVLTAKAIWPLHGGAEIRNFSLLKEASRHHEIYSLSFLLGSDPGEHVRALEPYCRRVETINLPRPKPERVSKAIASFAGGTRPFVLSEYHSRDMASALERMVREEKIDVIHAHCLHVGQYVEHRGRAAFVYDAHNLEHILWARFARVQKPLMRAFARNQIPKFVKWERHVGLHSEKVVMLSDDDRTEFLKVVPESDVATIPNGADVEFFQPRPDVPIEENSIIYFAHFGWPPQDDAALYLHNDILPLVRRQIPSARLYLVGRNPPPPIQRLAGNGVTVTGMVPDIREYIQRAAVVALPLRIGSGQKHRVFQSLAMEKPVVTTSVGAEGIALEHDVNALLSDDPARIAEYIVELLRDPERGRRIGRAGRELVLSRYEWAANYRLLDRVFAEAVEKRR
jgi:polysaccharide biosynthesis protein PslH